MPPSAVVFDIGNVLIRWDPEAYYDQAVGPERRRALFREVPLHAMNQRIDEGADFRAAVHDLAQMHPAWADEIILWHDDWLGFVQGEIDLSVRLMSALRARDVPVFALSNFGEGPFDMAAGRYPALRDFDRLFLSGPLGMVKPDAAIYAHLEAETGLSGDALIFVDDKPENLVVPASLGWHTHLFTDPRRWADCLVAHGLVKGAVAA